MKPIDKMSTGGVEIRLELADRLASIRQEQHRLVLLHALRFQQLPQSAPRLGIVGLHEAKAFRRRNIFGFTTPEGHNAFPGDDFEEARFMLGADEPAIDTDRHGSIRRGLRGPFVFGALEERVFFFTKGLFHLGGGRMQVVADRFLVERLGHR